MAEKSDALVEKNSKLHRREQMNLIYRGSTYQPQSIPAQQSTKMITAKYRGTTYQIFNCVKVSQQSCVLKYRGVEYFIKGNQCDRSNSMSLLHQIESTKV